MSKWLGVAVVVALASGCYSSSGAFTCKSSSDCTGGPVGTCQPNGSCSFLDTTCPGSMQRYGALSGQAGQCVDGQAPPPIDASIDAEMIDAPPDAQACFGTAPFTICLQSAPTNPVVLETSEPLDTSNSPMCVPTVSGGNNYCVIAATTIAINVKLRATGAKPLVLLASDTITAMAPIDVGSHRGVAPAVPELGAGADSTACTAGIAPGTGGGNGGGGAGGSFVGLGGAGGLGGNAGAGGVPGANTTTVTELRGGCPGQDGQGGNDKGLRGHGGGAVLLIAGNKIDVRTGINAAGEGGAGGIGNASGAGGGGAGGMIALDAPMITCAGLILATGGGGGEGSDSAAVSTGASGADPASTTAAAGGTNNTVRGGDGGSGSVAATAPGGTGGGGDNTGASRGGGGGGGGSAGLIKAPATATLGNQVAPTATP